MKILGVTFSSKSPAGELKDNWENIVENIEVLYLVSMLMRKKA